MRKLIVVAVLVAALVACRKSREDPTHRVSSQGECVDPPVKPRGWTDEPSPSIKQMKEAAKTNPRLCDELRAPLVKLTGEELVLVGPKERVVGRRSEIPLDANPRIELLLDGLRAYREQFRDVQPSQRPGVVEVQLDPKLETVRAVSVLLAIAYANYGGVRIVTGTRATRLELYANAQVPDAQYYERTLLVEVDGATNVRLQVRERLCEAPVVVTVSRSNLRERIAAICAANERVPRDNQPSERQMGRCVDAVELRLAPMEPFGESAVVVEAVTGGLADQRPAPDVAVLTRGIEPKMGLLRRRTTTEKLYAPFFDSSLCLPDGGSAEAPDLDRQGLE